MHEHTQRNRVPIFLSSTYEDLIEHRKTVIDVLNRFEAVVRGMELFGARPGRPKAECLAAVRASKVFIGLIAMRYGSLDAESGHSLTHLEFLEAERAGVPMLMYLIDERRQPVLPVHVDTGDSARALEAFKARIKARYTVSFFTTPDDLGRRLSQDLPAILEHAGAPVEPSELRRLVEAIPRLSLPMGPAWERLKKKVGPIAEAFPSDAILREVIGYLIAGQHLSAAYLVAMKDAELLSDDRDKLQCARLHARVAGHETFVLECSQNDWFREAIDVCRLLERVLVRLAEEAAKSSGGELA